MLFKLNAIQTLIHRAYKVCSNFQSLHLEFEFLRRFFVSNGYPKFLIEKFIRRFLDNVYRPQNTPKKDSHENAHYFSFPYFGHQSEKLKSELSKLLSKYFPNSRFKIILVNPLKIGSFFRFKDRIPTGMQASLVYEFRCARDSASVSYIGSTKRHLYERVAEHAHRSARTGNALSGSCGSKIKEHSDKCGCPINLDNFRVLGSCSGEIDLRLLESLFIYKHRPTLNDHQSAFPLNIVNRY